ncbi:protein IsiD [Leptolyngbya sp. AN02str]|uniref:protein IsiD n=1 Tax=Leptolyngbya sp. AN02str TaxID=3423363 RepID=UPI003D31A291
MKTLSFSEQDVARMTEQEIADLAERLERDEYSNAFEGLQDWHLLRAIAFQRPEMVEPYYYLLDMEAYDES